MTAVPPLHVWLERRDRSRNMARYYALDLEPSLFGDVALVRTWGRIGQTGRSRRDLFATIPAAKDALDYWLRQKLRHGYGITWHDR